MDLLVFVLVISSAVFHASWNMILRKATGNIVIVWLALFVGGLTVLPVAIGRVYFVGWEAAVSTTGVICVIASAVVHGIYFCLLAKAYEEGEISVIYPVTRGAGITLTALFALFVLNENISLTGATGICLILVGIFAIAARGFTQNRNMDTLRIALSVGTMVGAVALIDKVGVSNIDPILYICLLYLFAGMMLTPYILYKHRSLITQTARTYPGYIMTVGQGSIGTYLMILFAFTMGSVSYIVPMREFAVVVSVFLGIVFLKEEITIPKFIGIAAISVGLVCLRMG